jgi:hypothetical protein
VAIARTPENDAIARAAYRDNYLACYSVTYAFPGRECGNEVWETNTLMQKVPANRAFLSAWVTSGVKRTLANRCSLTSIYECTP